MLDLELAWTVGPCQVSKTKLFCFPSGPFEPEMAAANVSRCITRESVFWRLQMSLVVSHARVCFHYSRVQGANACIMGLLLLCASLALDVLWYEFSR